MTKKILIVQGAKIGDMVCTTPLFRAVKQTYPDARLYVLGNAINKELLAGNPQVDEYVVQPSSGRELRAFLKREGITDALTTSPNPSVLLQLLLARVGVVVVPKIEGGFSPYATKTYRLLSRLAVRVPVRFGEYMPRAYLRLLEPLGIYSDDTHKEIYFTQEALSRVKTMLAGAGFAPEQNFLVGIAPSAGGKSKIWPAERFAALCERLQKGRGIVPVITGTARDKEEVAAMFAAMPGVRALDLSGKLSIEELKALVSLLKLFIASDTGPVYIAEALGVPTVDIVGPMDEREQPPQGEMHAVVVPPRTAPALHIMNASAIDQKEARRQAAAVTVEMVAAATEALLQKIR